MGIEPASLGCSPSPLTPIRVGCDVTCEVTPSPMFTPDCQRDVLVEYLMRLGILLWVYGIHHSTLCGRCTYIIDHWILRARCIWYSNNTAERSIYGVCTLSTVQVYNGMYNGIE